MEGKGLLAFCNNFSLEIDSCGVNEEARLDTDRLDPPAKTLHSLVKASKFNWQNEVLGIFDTLRLVLQLQDEGSGTWSDAQLHMALGILIILILFLFLLFFLV